MATLTHYGSTHVMQLEANLVRIAHESAARDRQMSQVELHLVSSRRVSTTTTSQLVTWLLSYLVTYLLTNLLPQVVQLLEHIASSQDLSQIHSQDLSNTPPRQPPQPQPAPNNTPVAVPPRPAATTHGDPTDML